MKYDDNIANICHRVKLDLPPVRLASLLSFSSKRRCKQLFCPEENDLKMLAGNRVIIVSEKGILIWRVNQGVGGARVSLVAQCHLDLDMVFLHGSLGQFHIDGARIIIPGRDFAVRRDAADFDDIAGVGALPPADERLKIFGSANHSRYRRQKQGR